MQASSRRRGWSRGRLATLLGCATAGALAFPAAASAAECSLPGPSDPTMTPVLDIRGELSTELEGSFVYLPFEVPAATTAVRVRYCHDQPEQSPPGAAPNEPKHVLDLGVYEARSGSEVWGEAEFRGWAGSSIRDVTIAPNGYSGEAVYEGNPKGYVSGRTTRGYEPGPLPAGQWAAELGVAAVASREEGDADGSVDYRVQVELSTSSSWSDAPYAAAPYDPAPASTEAGWYAGDFHVHGEQEPGNATLRRTLDYAFAEYGGAGAGLDFITQVDHNNIANYGRIGAYQEDYPGKLIIRSTEVTTYRGHLQNHASGQFVDYRTGPLYVAELAAGEGISRTATVRASDEAREARPASEPLEDVRSAGGFTQINHPTIFPSQVPTFDDFCRGCSWEYSDRETDYSKVDAIEVATGPAGLQVATGPGPNPFTPLAIRFWEDAIDAGGTNSNRIAAVGSSDSHKAPNRSDIDPVGNVTDAPIGMATTMVYAQQLSEAGIGDAVRAGHTYVKPWGLDGPDVRLEASSPAISAGPGSAAEPAIIGDTIAAEDVSFTARVLNLDRARTARPGLYTLYVVRDGLPYLSAPIPPGDEFELAFPSAGPARYRLQVDRTLTGGASIEAVSSPVYHAAPAEEPQPPGGDPPPAGGGPPAGGPPAGDPPPGGRCANLVLGKRGADRLIGSQGDDLLRGRRGDDRIRGGRGNDCVHGGRGKDRIRGGGGEDDMRGGGGDDRIDTRDGRRDLVRCGPGEDRVRSDRIDQVAGNCE